MEGLHVVVDVEHQSRLAVTHALLPERDKLAKAQALAALRLELPYILGTDSVIARRRQLVEAQPVAKTLKFPDVLGRDSVIPCGNQLVERHARIAEGGQLANVFRADAVVA